MLAKGMNMGILSLLAVVVLMWAGLAGFFVFLARKAAANAKSKTTVPLAETTNSVR
jgi:flagellar basal body-associated protein FliL